jgi:hypothetical protein
MRRRRTSAAEAVRRVPASRSRRMVATTLASTRLLGRAQARAPACASPDDRSRRSYRHARPGSGMLGEVVDLTRSLFEADKGGLPGVGSRPKRGPVTVPPPTHGIERRAFPRRPRRCRWTPTPSGSGRCASCDPMPRALGDKDGVGLLARPATRRRTSAPVCLVPVVGGFLPTAPLGLLGLYHRTERTLPRRKWPWSRRSRTRRRRHPERAGCIGPWPPRPPAEAAESRTCPRAFNRLNRRDPPSPRRSWRRRRPWRSFHDIRINRVDWETNGLRADRIHRARCSRAIPEDADARLRVKDRGGLHPAGWPRTGEPLAVVNRCAGRRSAARMDLIDGHRGRPGVEAPSVVRMLYEGPGARRQSSLTSSAFNRFTEDDLQTVSIFARLRGAGDGPTPRATSSSSTESSELAAPRGLPATPAGRSTSACGGVALDHADVARGRSVDGLPRLWSRTTTCRCIGPTKAARVMAAVLTRENSKPTRWSPQPEPVRTAA